MTDDYMYDDDDREGVESDLAKEFKALCADVHAQIDAKLDEARKALREAQAIADKHGVPFRSGISPLSNSYVPANFSTSKFSKLDSDEICDISGVYGEYIRDMLDCGGWLHSAVC
jgi:hypothetical protein